MLLIVIDNSSFFFKAAKKAIEFQEEIEFLPQASH